MIDSFLEQLARAKVFDVTHFRGDVEYFLYQYVLKLSKVVQNIMVSWVKPLVNFYVHETIGNFNKLNSDASVMKGIGSSGGLLLDHEGYLVFVYYKEFGDVDVLLAESLSLLHGLRLYKDKGYHSLHV